MCANVHYVQYIWLIVMCALCDSVAECYSTVSKYWYRYVPAEIQAYYDLIVPSQLYVHTHIALPAGRSECSSLVLSSVVYICPIDSMV